MRRLAPALLASALASTLAAGGCTSSEPGLVPAVATPDVDPVFDSGQQVVLTPDGPEPRQLIAMQDADVEFINATRGAVEVIFVAGTESGPIAPGATWRWRPERAVSASYRTTVGPDEPAAIQVEPAALPDDG